MRPRRRIIDEALYVHFVTFSVDRRRRLLDHDHPKRIVLGVLTNLLSEWNARCLGFVLMLEHVHALLWFDRTGQLSGCLHKWKRQSSLNIRAWSRTEAPNYCRAFGEGRRFWLPKYYSFEIYERAQVEEKLDYMHLNPVRRGLGTRTTDWRWSSARLVRMEAGRRHVDRVAAGVVTGTSCGYAAPVGPKRPTGATRVSLSPQQFAAQAPHSISLSRARAILKEMEIDVPAAFPTSADATQFLESAPRLTPEQIRTFIQKAGGE